MKLELQKSLKSGKKQIAVWGIGYIGYSSMAHFAREGIKCIGGDISKKIYTILRLKVDVITKSQILGLTNPVLKRLANNELKMDLNYLKVVVENKIDYTNILTAEF